MRKSLLFSAAALTALAMSAQTAELEDITPVGYDFSKYEDGAAFAVQNPTDYMKQGAWSIAENVFLNSGGADIMAKEGQYTVLFHAGQARNWSEADMEGDLAGFVIKDFGGYLGKCLVANQKWSPLDMGGVTGYTSGGNAQIIFYTDPANTPYGWAGAAIRVRLVLQVWHFGSSYTSADAFTKVYAQNDGNNGMFCPASDNIDAAAYTAKGWGINAKEFYRWVGEGTSVAEIPETIEYEMGLDPIDPKATDPAYVINPDRFLVYEFDTFCNDSNHAAPLRLVLNGIPQNATIIFKEVKFFKVLNPMDLLDENDQPIPGASYLGDRVKSWRYYTEKGVQEFEYDGVEPIMPAVEAEGVAEYYNLQGVRVQNPENGLYIVKQGSKVSKQFVR